MGQAVQQPGAILLDLNARVDARRTTERLRGQRLLQLGIATGDLVIIVGATLLAAVRRVDMPALLPVANDVNTVALSVGPAIIVAWMLANVARGSYTKAHLGVGTVEYARVLGAAGLTAGAIGISSYLTKFELSRAFFVLLFLVGVPVLLLWRWSARRIVHRAAPPRAPADEGDHLRVGEPDRRGRRASCAARSGWASTSSAPWCRRTRPVEQTPGRRAGHRLHQRDRLQRPRLRGRPRALLRGRLPVGGRLPPDRLGPRGSRRADGGRPEPQRHLVGPDGDAPRRWAAARARRAAAESRGLAAA